MPWQLIYTSAPRGLLSGQTGFCTVARSADLREALAQRLEQISSYHYLRVAEAATAHRNPTISAFRLLDIRGSKYYVLTRIQPCGLDFTARTNHLAHHLVFQPDELEKLPSPAAILRHWRGWQSSWTGEPRLLDDIPVAQFAAADKPCLPAQTWLRETGDSGRAAGLLESECVRGCYLVCPPESEQRMLEMFCETLQLLNFNGQFPLRPWRHSFTTFLQAEDNPNDFQWRACQENTPAYQQAVKRSAPLIPLRSVRVPANDLVKLAREEQKPPPPPPPPDPSTNLSLRREPSSRIISAPSFPDAGTSIRPRQAQRPAFLDLNFSISSGMLLRVGIVALVLVILLLIKHRVATQPAEQPGAPPLPAPAPPPVVTSQPKLSADKPPPPLPLRQLDCLAADGPTYILAVPDLANFRLPINSISRFQHLLHRFNHFDTLPSDIRLEVGPDRWDFPPGVVMQVKGRANAPQLSASTAGLDCVFDYSGWLDANDAPVEVQTRFAATPSALSLHFGFYSTNHGDPFRLLVVNETNPPAPLLLGKQFVKTDRHGARESLEPSLWDSLSGNFQLLGGRQWQLEPLILTDTGAAQRLYKDWPAQEVPPFGQELGLTEVRRRLRAQRQDLKANLAKLAQPLERPLGQSLEVKEAPLRSFADFAGGELVPARFLEYLVQLKKAAPKKSWIKKCPIRIDPDAPEEAPAKLQRLYDFWIDKAPQDQPILKVTNAGVVTNYLVSTWQLLKETAVMQAELKKAARRLKQVDDVAYIGLFIVDPRQPKPELEMIRFPAP